jgi:ubiquinone/menaquinone biosynthesis C-methylase UbiE
LTYPDNTFDLSITVMGIMIIPDTEKALAHIYRTTKPGGTCYITSWHRTQHMDIAIRTMEQIRRPGRPHDVMSSSTKRGWEDPHYVRAQLEKVGFKDCGEEIRPEISFIPGAEEISFSIELITKTYVEMIEFEEGEQERWTTLWEQELRRECVSEDGLTNKMWANIGWGTK